MPPRSFFPKREPESIMPNSSQPPEEEPVPQERPPSATRTDEQLTTPYAAQTGPAGKGTFADRYELLRELAKGGWALSTLPRTGRWAGGWR
jgi:hypothetical protein